MWSKLFPALLIMLFTAGQAWALEVVDKSYPAVNGVQVFVLTEEPDAFFAAMKEKGVNTVFFRVFHNNRDRTHLSLPNPCPEGGVYFQTEYACVVSDLFSDVLAAGEKHGVTVYAWMATRSLSFLKTKELMSQSFTAEGVRPGYGASIFSPKVRTELHALFTDITMAGAEGILIQDDFIMKYNEGAEAAACKQFTEDTGNKCSMDSFFTLEKGRLLPKERNYQKWINWKARVLADFFKDLRGALRLINPEMKWAVNIYYETPVFPERGLAWYAHDTERFLEAGADYLAVMAYQEQIRKEMSLDDEGLLEFAGQLADNALELALPEQIIFKVQTKPFFGGFITNEARRTLYEKLLSHGAESFVELPIGSAADLFTPAKTE